jgi:hypothetical protein
MGPVTDVADLQEFMGALVERFDGDGVADAPGSPAVRYWEIYNEPDASDEWHAEHGGYGFFGNQGDVYAAHLDALYPVIKAASPKAQVVFGGVAFDNFDDQGGSFDRYFIDDVLRNCTGPCFDVMNFHYFPYYRFRWENFGRDVIGKVNVIRSKLASHGFDRPLMCTETSWPTGINWGSEVLQARYVIAGNVRGLAKGLVVMSWYAWNDNDPSLPGLVNNQLEPKPGYYAYQTMSKQLENSRFVRALSEQETGSSDVEGYVFDVPGESQPERLDVIWFDCPEYQQFPPSNCGTGTSYTLAMPASALQITDMYGNSSVRYDASDGVTDGNVSLEIRPDPIYVKHVQEANYDVNAKDDTINLPNCRFGVGAVGDISRYDVAALNLGWYVNFVSTKTPKTPSGMEFVQTIRLRQVGSDGWEMWSPRPTEFTTTVQSNIGATWLVGNEPDSPWQDDTVPEAYATAYHDVYHQLKRLDPTAKVGIGSIVQPTPVRFAYLDRVWDAYRHEYAEDMPVDVWSIHTYILRETLNPPDPEPCEPVTKTIPVWGAYIPPGIPAQTGELYCVRDQDNLGVFQQRIREFRHWMAAKGQRDKPLIVTEFGVLFYEDFQDEDGEPFSQERVGTFMTATFDFLLNETDPLVGYPQDGDRLVQRWAWFSLNANPRDWGGTLISETGELRPLGRYFQDYVSEITPAVDLYAVRAFASSAVFQHDGAPLTTTLKAIVSNIGNISTAMPISVTFYSVPASGTGTIILGEVVVLGGLGGCADYETVEVEWAGLEPGFHRFFVEVTGSGDQDVSNNTAEGAILVATHRIFLPLGFR